MQKLPYYNLDAIRGIAAILIVFRHTPILFVSPSFPQSYLAVDIFFAMSGFVVASAYETRLLSGELTFLSFLKLRLIRLFPLYLVGTLIGLASHFAQDANLEAEGLRPLLSSVSFALLPLLMLPSRSKPLFPVDNPAWSLFYEIVANSVYARMVQRATTSMLITIVIAAAIVVCACSIFHKSLDAGWNLYGWYIALARIAFSFTVGVLIYRVRPSNRIKSTVFSVISLFAVVLVLCADVPLHWMHIATAVEIIIVVPAIVYVATRYDPPSFFRSIFGQLGKMSYGVYIIHFPILILISKLSFIKGNIYGNQALIAFIAVVVACAIFMDRYFDSPMRQLLSRSLIGTARRPNATWKSKWVSGGLSDSGARD